MIELPLFSDILAWMTLLTQLGVLFLLIVWIIQKVQGRKDGFGLWLERHGITLAFLITTAATAGSLIYSEYFGLEPCSMCWYQRIFMYPQVILLGIAAWKNSKVIVPYSMTLLGIGTLIAANHTGLQMFGGSILPCSASGLSACGARYVWEFGYISIPMMALSAFVAAFLLLLHTYPLRSKKKKRHNR